MTARGRGAQPGAQARHRLTVVAVALVLAAGACTVPDDGTPPSPSGTAGPSGPASVDGDRDRGGPDGDRREGDERDGDQERTPGWSTADLDEPSPLPGWMSPPRRDVDACPEPTVRVADAEELHAALAEAGPGTSIRLAPGEYEGSVRGSTSAPRRAPGATSAGASRTAATARR